MFNRSLRREHLYVVPQLKVKICYVSSLIMMLAMGFL